MTGQAADVRRLTGFALLCAKAVADIGDQESLYVLGCVHHLYLLYETLYKNGRYLPEAEIQKLIENLRGCLYNFNALGNLSAAQNKARALKRHLQLPH